MTALGWDDLRLTTPEIVGLVRVHRPDLRGARLKTRLPRILQLANGWAAALTLLLHDRAVLDRDTRGIEEFSQRLFDYFATEIFSTATANERDFLLRTSVAPILTAELAARLTNTLDAGSRLADFERRSFLIQRLGTSRTYRYHPLLRGFLCRRAETELGGAEVQELHRRAAESFVESGHIDEAMDQFETANDVSMRKEFLLRVAPAYVASGRSHTVATWIERLPRASVDSEGWLLYWDALCCLGEAHSRALAQLEKAYVCFSRPLNAEGLYRSCAAAMQAICYEGNDFHRLDAWVGRVESMQAAGPACPEALLPIAATGMLMASIFNRTDPVRRRYWAENVMTLTANTGDMSYRVMTGGPLAMYFVFHDDPSRAAVILEMLRASARGAESSTLATLTLMEVDALCTWIRGENAACMRLIREALAIAARTGVFVWNDYLNHLGATAALGVEDLDAAEEFMASLAESGQRGAAYATAGSHFYASWAAMVRGDAARALHCLQLNSNIAETLGYMFVPFTVYARAQIEWQLGYRREANESLAAARQSAEETASHLVLHACDLVESDFAWEEDREHALVCLRRGLAVARACGYFNMLWLLRSAMARVAVRALDHGIETEYVRAYVVKHRMFPDHVPPRVEAWPWQYRLRAFGSFELTQENPDVAPTNATGRTPHGGLRGMPLRLLQAILAFGARGVRESQLIDALWPDAEGDAGRRVFDTTLHRLRRQLGADQVLRLSDGRVFLDSRSCWIDIWALEDIIAEVEREVSTRGRLSILEDLARRMVGVYRGPLLGDGPVADGWALGPRERIAGKFLRAAEPLGRALESGGLFGGAAALYQRVVEGHPLVEPFCAAQMRCALAAGSTAEAARIFEEYRDRLAAGREAEPGPEIASLYAEARSSVRRRVRPS